MDKERELFEEWLCEDHQKVKRDSGDYFFDHIQHRWEGWQAGRAPLLERIEAINTYLEMCLEEATKQIQIEKLSGNEVKESIERAVACEMLAVIAFIAQQDTKTEDR